MPDSNPSSTPLPAVFQVRIAPDGWVFAATPAQSVLQAGLAAGVELESSCRNGTCRTCLCRLDSGAIHYTIAWPGVSLDERREGYILPCVAVADTDLVIAAPAARKFP